MDGSSRRCPSRSMKKFLTSKGLCHFITGKTLIPQFSSRLQEFLDPKGKEEKQFDRFGKKTWKNGQVTKIAWFRRKLMRNIAVLPQSDPGAGMVHGEWKLGTENSKGTTQHHSLTPQPKPRAFISFMIRNQSFCGNWSIIDIIVIFQRIDTTHGIHWNILLLHTITYYSWLLLSSALMLKDPLE